MSSDGGMKGSQIQTLHDTQVVARRCCTTCDWRKIASLGMTFGFFGTGLMFELFAFC
jgi:hypothetical protein